MNKESVCEYMTAVKIVTIREPGIRPVWFAVNKNDADKEPRLT